MVRRQGEALSKEVVAYRAKEKEIEELLHHLQDSAQPPPPPSHGASGFVPTRHALAEPQSHSQIFESNLPF